MFSYSKSYPNCIRYENMQFPSLHTWIISGNSWDTPRNMMIESCRRFYKLVLVFLTPFFITSFLSFSLSFSLNSRHKRAFIKLKYICELWANEAKNDLEVFSLSFSFLCHISLYLSLHRRAFIIEIYELWANETKNDS